MNRIKSIFLSITIILVIVGCNKITNLNQVQNEDKSIEQDIININDDNIKVISEEQYYNIIADSRGVPVEEAERITKKVIYDYEKELSESQEYSNRGELSPKSINSETNSKSSYYYIIVYKNHKVDRDGAMAIEIGAPGILYSSGSFEQFVSIESSEVYIKEATNGDYTYKSFYSIASLSDDRLSVYLGTRGYIQITTIEGFMIGVTIEDLVNSGFSTKGSTGVYGKIFSTGQMVLVTK